MTAGPDHRFDGLTPRRYDDAVDAVHDARGYGRLSRLPRASLDERSRKPADRIAGDFELGTLDCGRGPWRCHCKGQARLGLALAWLAAAGALTGEGPAGYHRAGLRARAAGAGGLGSVQPGDCLCQLILPLARCLGPVRFGVARFRHGAGDLAAVRDGVLALAAGRRDGRRPGLSRPHRSAYCGGTIARAGRAAPGPAGD